MTSTNRFVERYTDDVFGTVSGFDRLRLRGTLRLIANASGMRSFLAYHGVLLKDFGEYVHAVTTQVKQGTEGVAALAGRPLLYLARPSDSKEQLARQIAERDGIADGLICTLKSVEVCWSYDIYRNRATTHLELVPASRKCLHYYHYLLHPELGFLHVRLQSWFPFTVHVCLNGREWLARQMDRVALRYERRENCFVWIEDLPAAQQLLDEQLSTEWPRLLTELAAAANPAHATVFADDPLFYYWSVDQSEWATDVLFRDARRLDALYPQWLAHGMQHLGSRTVMRFLGKRLHAGPTRGFTGEVVSDVAERPEGVRIKHRVNGNWIKMYNKQHSVLRGETVINAPRDLRVYRPKEGEPEGPKQWRYLRKGVADLHRRAALSERANERYLEALAAVDETCPLGVLSRPLCRRVRFKGHWQRALNPLAASDAARLAAIHRGEFLLSGFRNRELRALLYSRATDPTVVRRQAAAVTRTLRLLRAHGLIRKIPRTHRYLLTKRGQRIVAALLAAQHADTTTLVAAA